MSTSNAEISVVTASTVMNEAEVAAAQSCAVTLFSAETFKATAVRHVFSKLTALISSCWEHICEQRLSELKSLLKAAAFHTQYVNDLCFIMFVRLLSNLDHEENGQSVYPMTALLAANPGIAHIIDNNGMTLLHHLANCYVFSFFMARQADMISEAHEDDGESHVRFGPSTNGGGMEIVDHVERFNSGANEENPFAHLLHKLIVANREALYTPNKEGMCPIHVHCSEPIAGSAFLELMLWHSPSCARLTPFAKDGSVISSLHRDKCPLQMLMTQINCERAVERETMAFKCVDVLAAHYPEACALETVESFVRIHLNVGQQNGNNDAARPSQTATRRVWSPLSMAESNPHNADTLGRLMRAHLLDAACTRQQCLVAPRSSASKRSHVNLSLNLIHHYHHLHHQHCGLTATHPHLSHGDNKFILGRGHSSIGGSYKANNSLLACLGPRDPSDDSMMM